VGSLVPRVPTLSGVPDKKPAGTVALPGDALVIRFRPTDPDRVLKRAGDEYRRTGRHGASVFAAVGEPGETDVALKRRLLAVAELSGMKPEDHPKFYVCTRAEELYRRGFMFYRDGDDDEMDEHYSVDLGADAVREDAVRFLEAFDMERRDRQ
jgi:hypothetical protein